MKLFLLLLMTLSVSASGLKGTNPIMAKDLESLEYMRMVTENNFKKSCKPSGEMSKCLQRSISQLKEQVKIRVEAFDMNMEADQNFDDRIQDLKSLKVPSTLTKEGGWNFEGKTINVTDTLAEVLVSDLINLEEEISIDELIDIVFSVMISEL